MQVRIDSPQLKAFLRRLEGQNKGFVQRQIMLPAMRALTKVWLKHFRQIVIKVTGGRKKRSKNRVQLRDVLFGKAYAKPMHAPNVLVMLGTTGARAATLRRRREGAGVPAGVRLNFLRGTEQRSTHGGLSRQRTSRYNASGRLLRQAGANRGAIEDRGISAMVRSAAESEGFIAMNDTFQRRVRIAFSVRRAGTLLGQLENTLAG